MASGEAKLAARRIFANYVRGVFGARSCMAQNINTSIMYVIRHRTDNQGSRYQHRREVEVTSVPILRDDMRREIVHSIKFLYNRPLMPKTP